MNSVHQIQYNRLNNETFKSFSQAILGAKSEKALCSLTHSSFHTSFHLFCENYSNLNVSKEVTYHLPSN